MLSGIPDRRESVEALGGRPRQPLGFELLLQVTGCHVDSERFGLGQRPSRDETGWERGTVTCDVALRLRFRDVTAAFAHDNTKLDCPWLFSARVAWR